MTMDSQTYSCISDSAHIRRKNENENKNMNSWNVQYSEPQPATESI